MRFRHLFHLVALFAFLQACSQDISDSAVVRTDRSVSGTSRYPLAVDPKRVGTYPALAKSGAGYFYDEVLEYRVWFHPEQGAPKLDGDNDYYEAFAQYEAAEAAATNKQGAEEPLVLIRQLEWINEPEPGHYIPERGDRTAEWQVQWLSGNHRTTESIQEFLKRSRPPEPSIQSR
jgi:putative acetyltransferase